MVVSKFERDLLSAAQPLTDTFADLGDEIRTNNFESFGLFLVLDINTSQDVQIRAMAKHTANSADEFAIPIRTVSSSDVKIQDEVIELNDDVDQKVILQVDTDYIMPYVQIQVRAGTVGGTPGEITSAVIVRSQKVPGTY